MLVVADTSPLNYLVWIQQDTLLPILYDRVVIPPAVYEELQRPETPARGAAVGRPSPRLADHTAPPPAAVWAALSPQRLYDEVLAHDAARKANPPTDGR
jgi:hypothetical protein